METAQIDTNTTDNLEMYADFFSTVRDFGKGRLDPAEQKNDPTQEFDRSLFTEAANIGLTGLITAEEYGGMALDNRLFALLLEEVAVYSSSFAVTIAVNGLPQNILGAFGSSEQRSKWLGNFVSGAHLGAFALTEPHCGSDAAALKTTAKKSGDEYIINGSKQFITHGGVADVYMVLARTGEDGPRGISCFYVESDRPGLSVPKKEDKMGWRTSPTTGLIFEDLKVPAAHLVGQEGQGFTIAMQALDSGRITIAATAVGIARRALEEARNYLKVRQAFGKNLEEFQGLQWMIADMDVKIAAARLLTLEAARLKDLGKPFSRQASHAKLMASDTAMEVTTEAVQLLGGYGYMKEYPLERLMRDAKATQIVEGTNQIQRNIIAKKLLGADEPLSYI